MEVSAFKEIHRYSEVLRQYPDLDYWFRVNAHLANEPGTASLPGSFSG